MRTKQEFKFRVWGKFGHPSSKPRFIYQEKESLGSFFDHRVYPLTEKTIQQFTGLQDKSGRDIYEGDWLYSTDDMEKYEVVFYKGMFCVKIEDTYSPLYEYTPDGVVISNIFEQLEQK